MRQPLESAGCCWRDTQAVNSQAAVFVHGWNGHCENTWLSVRKQRWFWPSRQDKTTLLFDLLSNDANLHWDYYSIDHSAGPFSPVTVNIVSGLIRSFIGHYLAHADTIVLIGHSLGGIACGQAILDLLDIRPRTGPEIIGLLTLGTPITGQSWRT